MKKYKDASSFRQALNDTLSNRAKELGIDEERLRRDVAFDRFLVRLFSLPNPPWALKGGYAMQLRTDLARSTTDIDLTTKAMKTSSENSKTRDEFLRTELIRSAGIDIGDYFSFLITGPTKEIDGPPEGGSRFHIEARLADKSFQKFTLDIGEGDLWSEPLEELQSSSTLAFAGFEPRKFLAITKEQQFAEKLHAYTLPRSEDRFNSRVKDLIDMNLLIKQEMNLNQLEKVLKETFQKRNTHKLNLNLSSPPKLWDKVYSEMAETCGLDCEIKNGFTDVWEFLNRLKI